MPDPRHSIASARDKTFFWVMENRKGCSTWLAFNYANLFSAGKRSCCTKSPDAAISCIAAALCRERVLILNLFPFILGDQCVGRETLVC